MKTKENKSRKGISLIVLVITIIVIIILATAIIVSVLNNNPISEANKARFQSDRDNMQSIFTNTVAKVMAVNQGSISIKASELNEVKSGVSNTVGVASYSLENPANESNKNGTITFDNKSNTQTEYYTGKQLPIYKTGETTWYVDEEGIISLKVGNLSFGDTQIKEKEDGTLCMTEEEYQELLTKSQELISKTQELEQAKKEIEELKNNKEIPEGYLKPSGTIKITEVMNNIDVTNYQFADTSELLKKSDLECQVFEQTFPESGTTMTIDLGYIPQFIFVVGISNSNTKYYVFSIDKCSTFYVTSSIQSSSITSVYKVENNKIKYIPNNVSSWYGVKLKIYAIK